MYGGGGRVYPPRIDLKASPSTAPLVLCQGADDAARATGALIEATRRPVRRAASVLLKREAPLAPIAKPSTPREDVNVHVAPRAGVNQVETAVDAVALADSLLDPGRPFPLVVVTNATGQVPYLDASRIAQDLEELAEVHLLVQGEASWAFTGALPARLGVFGGAARVYPVQPDWLEDETRAPLYFCWNGVGAERITSKVIEAGLSAAHAAGLLTRTAAPAKAKEIVAVVVGGLGDFHVLVELPGGRQAVALAAAIRPGLPADRLVAKGQRLSGYADGDGGGLARFHPDAIADEAELRVRDSYPAGCVALAKVIDVGELSARVALHPDVEVWLFGDPSGPPLERLIDADDVIAVQIENVGDGLRCRLPDSDEEPLRAVSVVPGGPPWLVPADLLEAEEQIEVGALEPPSAPIAAPAPATAEAPTPAALGQLEAVRRERALLDARMARVEAELAAVRTEAARLRRSLREADKAAKQSAKRARELHEHAHGIGVFNDPVEQMRHEIWLQYLRRIPESQRRELPLAQCEFGPRFFESLAALEGVAREKVVDVLVEVLTGLVRSVHGRQLHQWRVGPVGPQETRADGAAAWRCSLQVNTASARRLKYWQFPGGAVEFDSVGVHDDGI